MSITANDEKWKREGTPSYFTTEVFGRPPLIRYVQSYPVVSRGKLMKIVRDESSNLIFHLTCRSNHVLILM